MIAAKRPCVPAVPLTPIAPEPTAAEIQEAANKSAREFLDATYWYILRHTETGAEIPVGIAALRQAKRESIV